MVNNSPKTKGLSDRSREQIAGKISEVFVENLKPGFDRLNENWSTTLFDTDDSILAAFPEQQQIVEQISEMSWARQKFSQEYIGRTTGSTVINIVKNSEPATFEATVPKYTRQMVAALAAFNKEYVVYVPLEGLTLGDDLESLRFGDANLVKMDEARIADLIKSSMKDELDGDKLEQELNEVHELLRDLDELLGLLQKTLRETTEFQTRFEKQEDANEEEQLKDERKTVYRKTFYKLLQRRSVEFEFVGAKLRWDKLEFHDHFRPRFYFDVFELLHETDLEKLRAELSDYIDELEYSKRKLRSSKAPLEALVSENRLATARLREPIDSLKGEVCARYSYAVEARKAIQYAEQSAASLTDLLRYGLAVVQAKHRGPRIGLQGEIARGHRTMLAITSDGSEIEAVKSAAGPFQPFEIAKEHVTIFQEALIFEIARLLSPSYGSLTEIEALIERCISWFSLSQMQADPSGEFLSLVIILEVLLTPSDRGAPISSTIADGAAILIADSEGDRKEIRRIAKEIYDTRSDIVHGSLTYSADFDAHLVQLRNIVIKLITVVMELNIRGKLKNNAKSDLTELINSTKFQGPSVLT